MIRASGTGFPSLESERGPGPRRAVGDQLEIGDDDRPRAAVRPLRPRRDDDPGARLERGKLESVPVRGEGQIERGRALGQDRARRIGERVADGNPVEPDAEALVETGRKREAPGRAHPRPVRSLRRELGEEPPRVVDRGAVAVRGLHPALEHVEEPAEQPVAAGARDRAERRVGVGTAGRGGPREERLGQVSDLGTIGEKSRESRDAGRLGDGPVRERDRDAEHRLRALRHGLGRRAQQGRLGREPDENLRRGAPEEGVERGAGFERVAAKQRLLDGRERGLLREQPEGARLLSDGDRARGDQHQHDSHPHRIAGRADLRTADLCEPFQERSAGRRRGGPPGANRGRVPSSL